MIRVNELVDGASDKGGKLPPPPPQPRGLVFFHSAVTAARVARAGAVREHRATVVRGNAERRAFTSCRRALKWRRPSNDGGVEERSLPRSCRKLASIGDAENCLMMMGRRRSVMMYDDESYASSVTIFC